MQDIREMHRSGWLLTFGLGRGSREERPGKRRRIPSTEAEASVTSAAGWLQMRMVQCRAAGKGTAFGNDDRRRLLCPRGLLAGREGQDPGSDTHRGLILSRELSKCQIKSRLGQLTCSSRSGTSRSAVVPPAAAARFPLRPPTRFPHTLPHSSSEARPPPPVP